MKLYNPDIHGTTIANLRRQLGERLERLQVSDALVWEKWHEAGMFSEEDGRPEDILIELLEEVATPTQD